MSLIPKRKGKQRSQTEDLDLLKLVGAVLDGAAPKPLRPRRTLRGRIASARTALRKLAQEHPFVSGGVLVVLLFFAFLIGMTVTTSAQKPSALSSAGGQTGPGYRGASGSSIVGAGSSASLGGAGSGSVVDRDLGRRDIAGELLQRVVDGDYLQRSDVATGRFLRDFENQWFLLMDVDRSQLQLARRGKGWVQTRGPYKISEARHRSHLTETNRRWKRAREGIIRIVQEDDVWKLEHIRVY